MNSTLQITGNQTFMGKEIPIILGGFGPDRKCISDKTVAEIHEMKTRHVRELINRNTSRFMATIDIIDLKAVVQNDTYEILESLGYTKQEITQAEHIYILSERGYAKLIKIMDTDTAWTVHDKLMDEYFELRDQASPKLPGNFLEALKALVVSEENKQVLQTQNLVLEQKVSEYEPKVQYVDKILSSPGTLTIKQIAQDYGLTAQELNEILHDARIQYKVNNQWILYREHLGLGYTKSDPIPITRSDGRSDYKLHTKWTQKGRYMIHQLLESRGIRANMDKEENQIKLGGIAI